MMKISGVVKRHRTLFAQILFTVLAFVVMAVLSYTFMSVIARGSLVRHANSVLDSTEDRITDTLTEFETTLDVFTEDARQRVLRGDSAEMIRTYIEEISRYSFIDGKQMCGIQEFFGYFETLPGGPVFVHSSSWKPPEGYQPERQTWYRKAIEADGGMTETIPVVTGTGETPYTYAKCIFDENGGRLGVVCLTVKIDLMGQNIVDTALYQGGYGMLINQDGQVLFHPNEAFKGIDIHNHDIPIYVFAEEIVNGGNIVEQPMISYKEEPSVVFFRSLKNGWRLGLVTPEEQYYQGLSSIGAFLWALAAILAAVLIGILIRLDAAKVKSSEESRQKSMFLANMSHEIRTPINAIVGMTAIGRVAGTTERKDYCFAKIDDASRHLLGVINDILDISKIEAKRIELSPDDFNFEKMLQQVVNVVNYRAEEKNQKLTVYIDKRIPNILYADDKRLAQTITNLLSNAVKFTPDNGEISLKTRLLSEKDGVYSIQIQVSDNGIGISKEQQAKLFQSFSQAESTTSRKYGGTGLGLSIAKSIVELMGGKITVESELGKGATFTFAVSAKRGDDTKYGFADYGINWGNIRILTVDDDRDILEYFHEIVNGLGAKCEVAADAGEALHMVDENGAYNIYFVDLKMPGVDGIALTKEIRAREEENGNSIVIMISSADLSAVEDEARKAGVDRFLLKPLFPSAIVDVINECIGIANEKEKEQKPDITNIFAGRQVLFAEDMAINREIVITLLEPTGVRIDCAENGMEAVQMIIREPDKYDLVFMDVQMPEVDGYEATRQIRSLDIPRAKDIPIVAMTANVFKEDVERCLAAGMNGHLGKPLDMDDLIRVMMQYLGGKA